MIFPSARANQIVKANKGGHYETMDLADPGPSADRVRFGNEQSLWRKQRGRKQRGGSTGGHTNTTAPWYVTYMVDAVHTGSPPVDSMSPYADGATVTVKPQGNLVWSSFPFIGWTTVDPGYNGIGANGGTLYVPGNSASDTFVIHSNVTLWAAWANEP